MEACMHDREVWYNEMSLMIMICEKVQEGA